MTTWEGWDNPAEAFKELDRKEYHAIAKALASYRRALMAEGFTRRESVRLVESYSAFLYDMTLNQVENEQDEGTWIDDDSVDPSDETE